MLNSLNLFSTCSFKVFKNKFEVLLAGDFNCHSTLWGDSSNRRGDTLEEWIHTNNITLHNEEGIHTWSNYRSSSTLDLTLSTAGLTPALTNWEAIEGISDHKLIRWNINISEPMTKIRSIKKTDWNGFKKELELTHGIMNNVICSNTIEQEAGKLARDITNTFKKYCPEHPPPKSKPLRWWNGECKLTKDELMKARRQHKNEPSEDSLGTEGKERELAGHARKRDLV